MWQVHSSGESADSESTFKGKSTRLNDFISIYQEDVLGQGSFSKVMKGWCGKRKRAVAIKALNKTAAERWYNDECYKRQADVLSKINHPNVMQLYEVLEKGLNVFLITEYCRGRNLKDILNEQNRRQGQNGGPLSASKRFFNEQLLLEVFRQLVSAMEVVHRAGIHHYFYIGFMHRDIKPQNLVLNESTRELKIIDFGVSRRHSGGFNIVGDFTMQGTPVYIAPNLFEGQYYSEKCDVWSAGVTMHELLTGTNYFEEAKKKNWNFLTNLHKQMENNPVRLSGEFSQYFRRVIPWMMTIKEEFRASFKELREDLEANWNIYKANVDIGSSGSEVGGNSPQRQKKPLNEGIRIKRVVSNGVPIVQQSNQELVGSNPYQRPESPPLEIPLIPPVSPNGIFLSRISEDNLEYEKFKAVNSELCKYTTYIYARAVITHKLAQKLYNAQKASTFCTNVQVGICIYLLECQYIHLLNGLKVTIGQPDIELYTGKVIRKANLSEQYQAKLTNSLETKITELDKQINSVYRHIRQVLYLVTNPEFVAGKYPEFYFKYKSIIDSIELLVSNGTYQTWAFYVGNFTQFVLNEFRPTSHQMQNGKQNEVVLRIFLECLMVCELRTWLPDRNYNQQNLIKDAEQKLANCPIKEIVELITAQLHQH